MSFDSQFNAFVRPKNAGRNDAQLGLEIRAEYARNVIYLLAYRAELNRIVATRTQEQQNVSS